MLTTPYDFEAAAAIATAATSPIPDEWCNCFKVSADGPPGLWRTVFPTDSDAERRGIDERRGRAGAAAEILSAPSSLTRSSTAISTSRISASRRPSARAACCSPAMPRTSTIRSAAWASTAASRTPPICAEKLAQHPARWRAATRCSTSMICSGARVATEFVQEQSIANKKRLEARDPEVAQAQPRRTARHRGRSRARARQFLLRTSMIAQPAPRRGDGASKRHEPCMAANRRQRPRLRPFLSAARALPTAPTRRAALSRTLPRGA